MSNSIRNACIFLITGNDRVLLVQQKKDNTWDIPGGMIDKTDKSPFDAMKREFKEETSEELPKLSKNVPRFDYHGHTRIYYDETQYRFTGIKQNKEINAFYFLKVSDLITRNGNNLEINWNTLASKGMNLRSYFVKSLSAMIRDKDFIIFIKQHL